MDQGSDFDGPARATFLSPPFELRRRAPLAVKDWARVHLFRTGTAVLTLVLLGLGFFYSPELITWWLRETMRLIEAAAGLLPYPWGDRVEIAMKTLGGHFWFHITAAILLVRVAAWSIAAGWRRRPSRRGAKRDGGRFTDA
jgi:hypothetical protein